MSESLVIVGGGEHARVLIDAARSTDRWRVLGFVDRDEHAPASTMGVPWLGDDERILAALPADASFVLGLAGVRLSPIRRQLVERYDRARVSWGTVVHASAVVSSSAQLAPGVVVFARAVLNAGACLGAHAIVNTAAVVEHDVRLGAFAQLGPGALLGGGVLVGDDAFVALGSVVRDHVKIGRRATVAMGAVVVRDVPEDAVVMGVPARESAR